MSAEQPLTPQMEQFALWYVRQPNGTKAAIRAGVAPGNAATQSWRWLKVDAVKDLIAAERKVRADRLRVTPERIVETLAAIGFGDAREVVAWDHEGNAIITPSHELHEDEAAMVEGIKVTERTSESGASTTTTEIKLSSKQAALDKLARIQGLYKDRVEVTDGDGLAARLEARRIARAAARAAAGGAASAEPSTEGGSE